MPRSNQNNVSRPTIRNSANTLRLTTRKKNKKPPRNFPPLPNHGARSGDVHIHISPNDVRTDSADGMYPTRKNSRSSHDWWTAGMSRKLSTILQGIIAFLLLIIVFSGRAMADPSAQCVDDWTFDVGQLRR